VINIPKMAKQKISARQKKLTLATMEGTGLGFAIGTGLGGFGGMAIGVPLGAFAGNLFGRYKMRGRKK
jgi:hypothetical protein